MREAAEYSSSVRHTHTHRRTALSRDSVIIQPPTIAAAPRAKLVCGGAEGGDARFYSMVRRCKSRQSDLCNYKDQKHIYIRILIRNCKQNSTLVYLPVSIISNSTTM